MPRMRINVATLAAAVACGHFLHSGIDELQDLFKQRVLFPARRFKSEVQQGSIDGMAE